MTRAAKRKAAKEVAEKQLQDDQREHAEKQARNIGKKITTKFLDFLMQLVEKETYLQRHNSPYTVKKKALQNTIVKINQSYNSPQKLELWYTEIVDLLKDVT